MRVNQHKRWLVLLAPIAVFTVVSVRNLLLFSELGTPMRESRIDQQVAAIATELSDNRDSSTSDTSSSSWSGGKKPRAVSCAKRKEALRFAHQGHSIAGPIGDEQEGEGSATLHSSEEGSATLPSFLVIGVHKGGTTSLYTYLTQHKDVRPAVCKETHFLSAMVTTRRPASGEGENDQDSSAWMQEYASYFPRLSKLPHTITGEATPSYIRDPSIPGLVATSFPNVRCEFCA
jgi:hypothetical protein